MDKITDFDFSSLKFDAKTNEKIKQLVMAHINGEITHYQIRKFIAQNEIRFAKLAVSNKNDSVKNTKAKVKESKPTIMAGKKKTPEQKNGVCRTFRISN